MTCDRETQEVTESSGIEDRKRTSAEEAGRKGSEAAENHQIPLSTRGRMTEMCLIISGK